MAETCRAMLDVLAGTRQCVPFAVALLREEHDVHRPRGVGAYGLAADAWSLGMSTDSYQDEAAVIDRVMKTGKGEMLTGLRDKYSRAILPGPLGLLVPDEAMLTPLTLARGTDAVGVLVLGISPHLELDEDYRSFLDLVASQIGVALTDTHAYQAQRARVQVLADLDLVKMEFFQNVSHELRTPLTLLLAPLRDVLDVPDAVRPDHRGRVETAVRAGERLRRIVDALLDFAQSEAGTLVPNRQPVDLARLTSETASMFRSAAERAGLRFEVIVPSPPLIVAADAGMWSTIVTNLIANAVKFTADGAITIELRQNRRHADGAADEVGDVVLTVTDTGVGVPPEEQVRVFERFFRARTSLGGAGIGLALVSDLVHAHDGQVALASTPNIGTTLTVSIPLAQTGAHTAEGTTDRADRQDGHSPDRDGAVTRADVVAAAGPASRPINNSRRSADRSRVLVVEDDADLRSYLAGLLTADGSDVIPIADAETALDAVLTDGSAASWDLVLTDVMLPGRTGLDLVAQLRATDSTSRVPIIVLTARGGADAAAEGLAAGADDYITKPFSSQELLARVRANIELHHVREGAIDDAEHRARQVRDGLESNRTIGTAVGVLMATYRLTAQQGFQLLVKASQDHNRKLRAVAADVASTGKLPFRPTDIDNLVFKITVPTR